MKRPKKSKKELKTENEPIGYDAPDYPYGLEISLEDESLKSLGQGARDFEIGGEISVTAKARVDRISSNKNRRGRNHDSVSLQITDMDLGGKEKAPEASKFDGYQASQEAGHGVEDAGEEQ
jgi:hypothetical protein